MASTGVRRRCRKDCPPKCQQHTWEFHVELPQGEDGSRRQVHEGGFRTMKDAKDARAAVIKRHRDGTLPEREQRKQTVRAYLEQWFAAKVDSGELRASTARTYRGHLDRYLLPQLGHRRLTDLRAAHVDLMMRDIRKVTADNPRPVGPTTERRILATLRSAIGDAVKRGELTHDHTQHVMLRKAEAKRVRLWTPEQFWGFRTALAAPEAGEAAARMLPLVDVTVGTGLRLGEVLGLRWEDVDLDSGELVVRQQAQQLGQQLSYVKPKTRSGEDRTVPLVGWVPETLQTVRDAQQAQREAWGEAYSETGLVFTAEDGTGLLPQSVSKAFSRLVVTYEMPALSFHGLRHTCAAVLLRIVPLFVVSRILGHSSVSITGDIYGHLLVDAGVKEQVDRALRDFQTRGTPDPDADPGVRGLRLVRDLPA